MAFGYCAGLLARMLRFDPSLTKVIVYRLFSHYIIKSEELAKFLPSSPGGTPLYGLYRYVRPQRVWFFSCFGHK